MKMVRLLIQVPEPIKARLDALRQEGTTASGFIRHLLEDHFKQAPKGAGKDGERWREQDEKIEGLLSKPDSTGKLCLVCPAVSRRPRTEVRQFLEQDASA